MKTLKEEIQFNCSADKLLKLIGSAAMVAAPPSILKLSRRVISINCPWLGVFVGALLNWAHTGGVSRAF